MKILGIDPGSARTGYSLIETKPRLKFITAGTINFHEVNQIKKLLRMGNAYERLLGKFKPDLVALEKNFFLAERQNCP